MTETASVRTRTAVAADVPALSKVLCRSFAAEPFHRWMVPDDVVWQARAPRFFAAYLRLVLKDGAVDTVEDLTAAALWLTPDRPSGSYLSRMRVPFLLWRLLGSRFSRVWAVLPEIDRRRPHEPHWYLDVLGVDPDRQNQGLGTALLEDGLARADRSGKPVFVDTLEEESVALYERHGFKVTDHFTVGDGLPIWAMVRAAR